MIPGAFAYHRPPDLAGALDILSEHGDEARVIAGGHSLIPMMKLRMAQVDHLVDLQDIEDLREIGMGGGVIQIGAMVTMAELITHERLAEIAPILREAALQIADPQVRNVGTIGGNVANGDPGNDMPAVMQCLDATFWLDGSRGHYNVAARDFYHSAYVTERRDDEILTLITFGARIGGYVYEKQKRKIGDYATAAAAVTLTKQNGRVATASIAMTNLRDTPAFAEAAGDALVGTACDADSIKAAVENMQSVIDPGTDNRGPAAFKRHAAGAVLTRAILRAWSRA